MRAVCLTLPRRSPQLQPAARANSQRLLYLELESGEGFLTFASGATILFALDTWALPPRRLIWRLPAEPAG